MAKATAPSIAKPSIGKLTGTQIQRDNKVYFCGTIKFKQLLRLFPQTPPAATISPRWSGCLNLIQDSGLEVTVLAKTRTTTAVSIDLEGAIFRLANEDDFLTLQYAVGMAKKSPDESIAVKILLEQES
jgi:hypothetical protein